MTWINKLLDIYDFAIWSNEYIVTLQDTRMKRINKSVVKTALLRRKHVNFTDRNDGVM